MKLLAGKNTLLVAAILGLQQLSSGLPSSLTAPKPLENLIRRIEPIIPRPVPRPEPVTSPAEPGTGAPRIGGGSDPAAPANAPPRFGGGDASGTGTAPKVATLGTEDELVAMGLKPGTSERIAFDVFSTWFGNIKATNTETPWIFFTKLGDDGNQVGGPQLVPNFQKGFKEGKYRLPGDDAAGPNDKIQQMSDVFAPADLPDQVGPAPKSNTQFWFDMVSSYGGARLAAVRGGKVRILMPKGELNTPESTFWTNFEAYEVTKPGSNVQEVWRYNSAAFDDAPILIWRQGDPAIGKQADFVTTMEPPEIDMDI